MDTNKRTSAAPHRARRSSVSSLVGLAAVIFALATWSVVTPRYVTELALPSPGSVVKAAIHLNTTLLNAALITLARVLVGWIFGAFAGILTGLAMTRSKLLYELAHPFIEAIRPLPTVILIPFFILWFGIGDFGQVLLIVLGSFMTLTIHTISAVNAVPLELIRAAVSLGASASQVYRRVLLPNILPGFQSAFQIAAALSFAVGIAAEFIGAQAGIGFLVMVARRTLNTDVILLGTIIIAFESWLVDLGIRKFFKMACPWAVPPVSSLRQLARSLWR